MIAGLPDSVLENAPVHHGKKGPRKKKSSALDFTAEDQEITQKSSVARCTLQKLNEMDQFQVMAVKL